MALPNPIGSKIELNGVANYKAIAEQVANVETLKEVLANFDLLAEKPLSWDSANWDSQVSFYTKETEGFVTVPGTVPTFNTTKFYFTAATGGTAIQTQPADWTTNYKNYYVADTEDGARTKVASAPAVFVANTYYSKKN